MTKEEMKILYDYNYHSLYGYILTMIPKEFAHDVIMDVFVCLFNDPKFENNRIGARSYLFHCVKNKCIDVMRREKLNRKIYDILLKPGELYSEFQTVIDQDLGEAEQIKINNINNIKKIINLLSGERVKEVLRLSFIDGLPNKEISERLGLAPRTILNTKHMGIKRIKEQLKIA